MNACDNRDLKALRSIAEELAAYREEVVARLFQEVVDECDKVAEEFDPAQGRGRGPWWADGG